MKYYLLDEENISVKSIWKLIDKGCLDITKDDYLIVFNNKNTKYESHVMADLFSYFGGITIEEASISGKNGLDFYLITCLSLIISKHPQAEYCILSKDKGYEASLVALNRYCPDVRVQRLNPFELDTELFCTKIEKTSCVDLHEIKKQKLLGNYKKTLTAAVKNSKKLNTKEKKQEYVDDILNYAAMAKSGTSYKKMLIGLNLEYGLKEQSYSNVAGNIFAKLRKNLDSISLGA